MSDTPEPKKRGRPRKYHTPEEQKAARAERQRRWLEKRKARRESPDILIFGESPIDLSAVAPWKVKKIKAPD